MKTYEKKVVKSTQTEFGAIIDTGFWSTLEKVSLSAPKIYSYLSC